MINQISLIVEFNCLLIESCSLFGVEHLEIESDKSGHDINWEIACHS